MNHGISAHIGKMAAGCLLGVLVAQGAQAQSNIVNRITPQMFTKYHSNLYVDAGQGRGFTTNADSTVARKPTKQHNLARDYILKSFQNLGISARLQAFTFNTSFGGADNYDYIGCNNVIATIPGTSTNGGYFIIGAYYDTLDAGQPNPLTLTEAAAKSAGADMDATGVAALLCLAEAFRDQQFRSTIILVAFDASQKNFAGSSFFVEKSTTDDPTALKKIPRSQIKGMVCIDTIGYGKKLDGSLNTVLMYGGAVTPDTLRTQVGAGMVRYAGLDVIQGGAIQSSDHVSFWDAGIPACSVSEALLWENPSLYTGADNMTTPKLVNAAYAAKITRGVAGFLVRQAKIQL